MLKAIVFGMAAGLVLAGSALARPLPLPVPGQEPAALLVKHDKDKDGPGRKLGHYKHRGGRDYDDWRRSSTSRTVIVPVPVYPPGYYDPPGYGSSLPPVYYGPPPY
jgi:hypothetical protein